MLGGSSSEESDDDMKSDNESDYDGNESSDDDINGDDDDHVNSVSKEKSTMITRGRRKSKEDDDPVVISIAEAAKLRERKPIAIVEAVVEPATVSSVLLLPSKKRKRDSLRLPAERFKISILGSSSSSSSSSSVTNNVSVAAPIDPVEISSQSQANVNGGTITTTSSSSSSSSSSVESLPQYNLTRIAPQETAMQPRIPVTVPRYTQAQMDSMTRSNFQDSIFGVNPNSVPLGSSSSSSSVQAQPQANFTRSSSSSSQLQRPNYQQHGPYDLRQQRPVNPYAFTGINSSQMEDIARTFLSFLASPSSKFYCPNFFPGGDSTLVPSFPGNIVTRPSGTLSDVLGSSSSSSVEAEPNATRQLTSGLLPPMPNDQHNPSSMDVRGLDLNMPANNEDGGEKKR